MRRLYTFAVSIFLSLNLCFVICQNFNFEPTTCFLMPQVQQLMGYRNNSYNNYTHCNRSLLTDKHILRWNETLKNNIAFLKVKYCMSIKDSSYISKNETCMAFFNKIFAKLVNQPLCCSVMESSDEYGCYYNILDQCASLNKDNSIAFALCKKQLSWYVSSSGCTIKGIKKSQMECSDWNNNLHVTFYIAGCYNRSSQLTNMAVGRSLGIALYNQDTLNFLARSFCAKTATRDCCRHPALCNAPQQQSADWGMVSDLDTDGFVSTPPGAGRAEVASVASALGFWGSRSVAKAAAAAATAAGVTVCVAALAALLVLRACRRRVPASWVGDYLTSSKKRRGRRRGQCREDAGNADSVEPAEGLALQSAPSRQQQQQQQAVACRSSSGAGNPNLVRRTVARETTILEPIGQGRFGQVFKGTWRTGDFVAVKLFHSRAEASWCREGEIYNTRGLQHPAILAFVAIDNLDAGWETQLWLITEYHTNGSLQSYLTENQITGAAAVKMCHSVASGLAHLHSELVTSCYTKPGIAHCDVKSNNVLVKADLTCCLADFGLAVRETDHWESDEDRRVGTIRYQSPELLDGTFAAGSFAALKQADVYAMGLVLWEIGHRCCCHGYSLPYADLVSQNPALEDMRQLVCPPACARPSCAQPHGAWSSPESPPICVRLADGLLDACWRPDPAARISAPDVKSALAGFV